MYLNITMLSFNHHTESLLHFIATPSFCIPIYNFHGRTTTATCAKTAVARKTLTRGLCGRCGREAMGVCVWWWGGGMRSSGYSLTVFLSLSLLYDDAHSAYAYLPA